MNLCTLPRRAVPALLIASGGLLLAPAAQAQGPAVPTVSEVVSSSLYVPSDAAARGKYVVVVDLDTNQLHLVHQRRIIWSATVGTGTGLRLEGDADDWEFSTPNGTFHVQYKEEVPTWRAPDWYFIENGLPVPPQDDPKRLFPGGLGAAAIYIGKGLAIHGTDRPELLGERVSHGCIRMSNTDAQRLFHNVTVGTEVIIVGTPRKPAFLPVKPVVGDRDKSKGPLRSAFYDSVIGLETSELTARLDDELWMGAPDGPQRWTELTSILISRGLKGDDEALRAVLLGAGRVGGAQGREYATFLADAYSRGALRVMRILADLPDADRAVAARAIVEASVDLYPGDEDAAAFAWPTRRVPRSAVPDEDTAAWEALRDSERVYRDWRARRDRLRAE